MDRFLSALLAAHPEGHRERPFRPTVRGLVEHAARLTRISAADLISHRRTKPLANARKAICWVAIKVEGRSYPMIGRALGGRDHSTIIHACRAADILIERDPEFVWLCERLWAAAECEPFGPAADPETAPTEPEPEPESQAKPEVKPAPPRKPPVAPARVRTVEGEYVPRHALPPVMAVVDDDLLALHHDDDIKRARYRSAEASNAMLDALHRAAAESAIA